MPPFPWLRTVLVSNCEMPISKKWPVLTELHKCVFKPQGVLESLDLKYDNLRKVGPCKGSDWIRVVFAHPFPL